MKGIKKNRALVILIALAVTTTQNIAFADVKKVGRTSTSAIVNTILSGKGVPSPNLGNNGDFYIDKVNMNFYGPKVNGVWPLPISQRDTQYTVLKS